MPLGVSSDVSWERPRGLLGRLGSVLAVPEASGGVLGASGGLLGTSWGHLWAILAPLMGACWGHLGGDRSKKRV
eukprot:7897226-Pyramimonas_sp.AAC.1